MDNEDGKKKPESIVVGATAPLVSASIFNPKDNPRDTAKMVLIIGLLTAFVLYFFAQGDSETSCCSVLICISSILIAIAYEFVYTGMKKQWKSDRSHL